MTLEVFDFKTCDDFSVNIKFPSADQNLLKRIIFWLVFFSLVLFKLFELHASFEHFSTFVVGFLCFCFCFF